MLKQVWQDFFKGDITMMNKIIKRALMGFMYGVFIGQTIVLLESLFVVVLNKQFVNSFLEERLWMK